MTSDDEWNFENGGNINANSDQGIGTRRTFPGGAAKEATLTADSFTWGDTPDQIFQTPSSARHSRGKSGPRIGVEGTNGRSASVAGHGGKHTSEIGRQRNTGDREIGAESSGASGSFFTSMQQWPSSLPSQSGQHFGFSEPPASLASQPGRRTASSMKQTRTDDAEAGTSRAMQSKRKVAVIRRITFYGNYSKSAAARLNVANLSQEEKEPTGLRFTGYTLRANLLKDQVEADDHFYLVGFSGAAVVVRITRETYGFPKKGEW